MNAKAANIRMIETFAGGRSSLNNSSSSLVKDNVIAEGFATSSGTVDNGSDRALASLAARGESKGRERSGTASQFASGQVLCFEGHDGGRIGGSPHFSLLRDFCHKLYGFASASFSSPLL